jgi:hypothetical protein
MPQRYRVVGFVTYGDERGRRCPIPIGETVEVGPGADGGGTMTWQDASGHRWSELLSDRLLAHYTGSQLESVPPPGPVGRKARSISRMPMHDARNRRRV